MGVVSVDEPIFDMHWKVNASVFFTKKMYSTGSDYRKDLETNTTQIQQYKQKKKSQNMFKLIIKIPNS